MPASDMIQPADNANPPVPQVQAANPDTNTDTNTDTMSASGPKLSEKLLKMPAMQALFAGAPPALSAPVKDFTQDKREEAKIIKDNLPALQAAGFGFYQSLSKHLGVIYNMLHLHEADLKAADKMGKLRQLAPDFDQINHAVAKSGARNPVLAVRGVPKGFKSPTPVAPPQVTPQMAPGPAAPLAAPLSAPPAPQVAQAPAGVQRGLSKARLTNMQPGAPTSGPSPGAGRLLNQILKPVV